MFETLVLSISFVFFCILQLLHLDVSKTDRDVAYGMHVGNGQQLRRRLGWRGPTAGALARSLCEQRLDASARIGGR